MGKLIEQNVARSQTMRADRSLLCGRLLKQFLYCGTAKTEVWRRVGRVSSDWRRSWALSRGTSITISYDACAGAEHGRW